MKPLEKLAALTVVTIGCVTIGCAPPPAAAPTPSAPPPPPASSTEVAPPSLPRRSAGLQVVLDLQKSTIPVMFDEPSLDLQPMRGRTFVTVQDVLFYIDGDTLRSDPALRRGLSDLPRPTYNHVEIQAMGGHWPDAAWLQVTYRGERMFRATFLRWKGDEWVEEQQGDGVALRILPLASDWSLVVSQNAWPYSPDPARSLSMLHRRAQPMTNLGWADSVATLPDGSLFAARNGRVERWAPDGARLPLAAPAYHTGNETPVTSEIVALSPTALYLLNTLDEERAKTMELKPTTDPPRPARQLLRFDGQRWVVEPTPLRSPDRMFAGPRGALWVGQGDDLFERAGDGRWAALDVPARVDKVWVSPEDDVWAISGSTLLLHTRPLPAGVDLPSMVPPSELMRFSASCLTLTALLDEVPRTTPDDFGFRAQLDGLAPTLGKLAPRFAFYDLRVAGRRHLAAHVPAYGQLDDADHLVTVGTALVAQARRRGTATARLACVDLPEGVSGARLLRGAAPLPAPPRARPRPVSLDTCGTPMVVLFAPAKTAPRDFDFPLTRKALRGHTELAGVRFFDLVREGKRVIVATAPDRKAAVALMTLLRREIPSSTPSPACAQAPAGAREIKVDLATGNVVK